MRAIVILIAALVGASVARADVTCPENFYQCNTHLFSSFEPRVSLECLAVPNQTGRSTLSYDLVTGQLTSFSAGLEDGAGASVLASDHYELLGPPDTVCAMLFRVNLHVVAKFQKSRFNGEGDLEAFVQETNGGPISRIHLVNRATAVTDTVLSLELSQCPGNGFELHYELDTAADGGSYTATAQLEFTDLHRLVTIVSCQGFRTEQPVPALPVTWARVKSHYR